MNEELSVEVAVARLSPDRCGTSMRTYAASRSHSTNAPTVRSKAGR